MLSSEVSDRVWEILEVLPFVSGLDIEVDEDGSPVVVIHVRDGFLSSGSDLEKSMVDILGVVGPCSFVFKTNTTKVF